MNEQQLRAIHAQACAAVALVDRTITPIDERFWPLYLSAAIAAAATDTAQAPRAETIDSQRYRKCREHAVKRGFLLTHEQYDAMVDESIERVEGEKLRGGSPSEQRMSDAERDVLAERARQVNEEGWTPEHDDAHRPHEMSSAAGCYAMYTLAYPAGDPPPQWPWHAAWWKPTTHRRNLIKACALLLAEIERIDRDPGDESIHHHTRGGDHA